MSEEWLLVTTYLCTREIMVFCQCWRIFVQHWFTISSSVIWSMDKVQISWLLWLPLLFKVWTIHDGSVVAGQWVECKNVTRSVVSWVFQTTVEGTSGSIGWHYWKNCGVELFEHWRWFGLLKAESRSKLFHLGWYHHTHTLLCLPTLQRCILPS